MTCYIEDFPAEVEFARCPWLTTAQKTTRFGFRLPLLLVVAADQQEASIVFKNLYDIRLMLG